jgi:hypothetical protein
MKEMTGIISMSLAGLVSTMVVPALSHAQNQTEDLSPLIQGQTPFTVTIEQIDWKSDPLGTVHSAAVGEFEGQAIIVGGMSAGMHGFACDAGENFPSTIFNHTIYMINVQNQTTDARLMTEKSTGLDADQIASMATTNTLYEEVDGKLLVVGGYGINAVGDYVTFDSLRVMNVSGVIGWVSGDGSLLADHVTFHDPPANTPSDLADDFFTVTGGIMLKNGDEYWMCLGQNFQGGYTDGGGCPATYDQVYTKSIRRFRLDVGDPDAEPEFIGATAEPPTWARRRDLNILPARVPGGEIGGVALAGVFTDFTGGYPGIWTVPIVINGDGTMSMDDPTDPSALRQGFNAYNSGRLTLWSESRQENWFVTFGGLGYQVLWNGELYPDPTIPYSNDVMAVRYRPESNEWSQHLLEATYPDIYSSTGELYFHGTESLTIPRVPISPEGLYDLDSITEPTVIAWIYGGILSTGQAIVTSGETFASNYLFKVIVEPVETCIGDLNKNGIVDGADLSMLLAYWGKVSQPKQIMADLNDDGIVNEKDLTILLNDWGPCQ